MENTIIMYCTIIIIKTGKLLKQLKQKINKCNYKFTFSVTSFKKVQLNERRQSPHSLVAVIRLIASSNNRLSAVLSS
jgi:hypothetical protein